MSVAPGFASPAGATRSVALQPQVVVETARVQMTGGRDEGAVPVDGPHVLGGATGVGVGGVVGIRVLAVVPAALRHVEHGIRLAVLDVHPDRPHRNDALRRRRGGRDEVDVVGDPHLRAVRGEVVDHVVEIPVVGSLVGIAVARRELQIRLLLPHREEPLRQTRHGRILRRQVQPHRMMQVDDIDTRRLAVRVLEVRTNTDDPTVDGWPLRDAVRNVVLAGLDRERTNPEMQPLGAGLDGVVHGGERRDVPGVRRSGRIRRGPRACSPRSSRIPTSRHTRLRPARGRSLPSEAEPARRER